MSAPSPHLRSVCCLLLLFIAGSRQLSITEFAVPSAIEAGTNAELQCRFSADGERVEYIKWWWTPLYGPTEDRNRVLIYQHLTGLDAELPRKNVEGKENDTIVVLDMKAVDSGVYECEVSGSGDVEVRKHEELIVFSNGTDFELNVTTVADGPDEGDAPDALVQCEAHDVTPQPELAISINGIEIENLKQHVTGGAKGLFDVFVNVTVPGAIAENAAVRCELFYQNKNISHPPYMDTVRYTTGAGLSTTETPEDTTHSEVASELQNTNAATDLHASLWVLYAAAVIKLYVLA